MLTGYTSNLPTDTLLGTGVLFCARSGANVRLGVTDGAPDFDPGVELSDIQFDQKPSRLKGTIRRTQFQPVIKGVLKEFGPSASGAQIGTLETASTEATVGGVTTTTPVAAGGLIAAGSYLTDIRWIFERASGGYAAIYFPIAHVRKWTKKGVDKKEAQIQFEVVAVGDPVNDLGTAPYAIEIRTSLPGSVPADGSIADVRSLIPDSQIVSWWDAGQGVTLDGSGNVATVNDVVLGAASQLTGFGTTKPAYNATTKRFTTDGSQNYFKGPIVANYDPERGATHGGDSLVLVVVGDVQAGTGIQYGLTDDSLVNVFALGKDFSATPTETLAGYTQNGVPAYMYPKSLVPDGPTLRLMIMEYMNRLDAHGVSTGNTLDRYDVAFEAYGRRRVWIHETVGTTPDTISGANLPDVTNLRAYVGAYPTGAGFRPTNWGLFMVLNKVPTLAQRQALARRAAVLGYAPVASPPNFVMAAGDSITQGLGLPDPSTQSWPAIMQSDRPALDVDNRGVAGRCAVDYVAELERIIKPDGNPVRTTNWMVLFIGTNDLLSLGRTPAQVITDVTTICDAWRNQAPGTNKVCLVSCLPRTGLSNTTRNAYNTSLAGLVGTHADCFANLDTVTQLSDPTNVTYYQDGTHPTAAGMAYIPPVIEAAMGV